MDKSKKRAKKSPRKAKTNRGINKKIISKAECLAGKRFALHGQKAFFVGLTADGLVLERQQNACAANAVGAGALVFAEAELGQPEPVVLLVNNIISRQIRRFERCKLSRSVRRKFRVEYAVDGHQNIRAGLKKSGLFRDKPGAVDKRQPVLPRFNAVGKHIARADFAPEDFSALKAVANRAPFGKICFCQENAVSRQRIVIAENFASRPDNFAEIASPPRAVLKYRFAARPVEFFVSAGVFRDKADNCRFAPGVGSFPPFEIIFKN